MSFLNRFKMDKPQDDVAASVVRNLNHLLSSRCGYGSQLCRFGLGDYLAMPNVRSTAEAVMLEVLRDIELYEPRLVAHDLRVINDGELPLAFELRGELRVNAGSALLPHAARKACRLGILFDPYHGEALVHLIEILEDKAEDRAEKNAHVR